MYGLVVHGLPPPTMQRCSSSATRSEGQRLSQFFVPVFLDIRTGQPPGSHHESLPSHDAPGDFFSMPLHQLTRRNLNRDLCPHITFGMARPFLPSTFWAVHLTHAPKARHCSLGNREGGRCLIAVLGLFPRPGTAFGEGFPGRRGENCRTPRRLR